MGLFVSKSEAFSLPNLKGLLPFRLATTSYILPAEILPNVRFLGQYLDEIELVFFESGRDCDLPSQGQVCDMARIASDLDITYNVHLPADLFFGDPDPVLRRRFCETALSFYGRTLPLAPTLYILHLDCRRADKTVETDKSAWSDRVIESLQTMQREGMELRGVAAENLDYPPEHILPFVEAFEMSFCLDIGHLLKYGHNTEKLTAKYIKTASMVHLHGVDKGRDHRGLEHIPATEWEVIRLALESYCGGVSVEVFSLADLTLSLNRILEMKG